MCFFTCVSGSVCYLRAWSCDSKAMLGIFACVHKAQAAEGQHRIHLLGCSVPAGGQFC